MRTAPARTRRAPGQVCTLTKTNYFYCTLPSQIAYKSRVPSSLGSSCPEKDWSIQLKCRQDKLQDQAVYQRTFTISKTELMMDDFWDPLTSIKPRHPNQLSYKPPHLQRIPLTVAHAHIQWSLRITDTLVHRPLSFIRGMSFTGVFLVESPPTPFISQF